MRRTARMIMAWPVLAGGALADPYPFSGYFAMQSPGSVHANCAFDILRQREDGAFSGYLLDRSHWDTHGEARFLRYKFGKCMFEAATRTDNCIAEENRIAASPQVGPDRARITIIDEDRAGMLTLGPGDDPSNQPDLPPFVFVRCPFDEATIAPLLSEDVRAYTAAELREMTQKRDADVLDKVLAYIARRAAAQ